MRKPARFAPHTQSRNPVQLKRKFGQTCGDAMDIPTIHPPALRRGDTIAIIAPAGPVESRASVTAGAAALERMGFRVQFDERIFDAQRYLAGADIARAAELNRCFESTDVQAVLPLRGGYGCARLIPLLDEKRLRHNCKFFMGFSDLTTLHLFFRRRLGWATVHGPMATSASLAAMSPAEEEHLLRLLTDSTYLPHYSFPETETWFPGTAGGRLAGGCLSIILASLGTPYEIRTEGKILFLEDLGEAPYRIDRMITQLRLAGKLQGIAGVLLGAFLDCLPTGGDYTIDEVLRELLEPLQVPTMAHFPAGHGPANWAIPLGLPVRLDADQRRLQVLEPLVAPR
jgi:muramoyltetrapeptide carboxypeptidase